MKPEVSPTANPLRGNRHHWLAAAVFGGMLAVWGAAMVWTTSLSSAADAQAGTVVTVFAPADERAAMTAIRAAGGLLVANPAAGTWVVHGDDAGLAGRLRDEGALGVFTRVPVALPGASGCFFLPDGQHALFTRRVAAPGA